MWVNLVLGQGINMPHDLGEFGIKTGHKYTSACITIHPKITKQRECTNLWRSVRQIHYKLHAVSNASQHSNLLCHCTNNFAGLTVYAEQENNFISALYSSLSPM